jgi:DNA-binding transcriptional LysR family regulator
MRSRWDDVRYFLAASEQGSFSAAARALGVEQSTVSRRIAALEEELGGALFVRGRSGLVATERGAQILPLARDVQRSMLELVDASAQEVEGVVRVATTEGVALHGLVPALPELLSRHPGLRVRLVTGFGVSDLTRREADVALRFARPTHADLVYRQLATLPYGVFAAPRWSGCAPEDLDWLDIDLGAIATPRPPRDPSRPPALVTDSYVALVQAARHGLGAALLTRPLGAAFDDLVELDLPAPLPDPIPVFLVGHTANRHTPRVAAVWSFLEEWVARELAAP